MGDRRQQEKSWSQGRQSRREVPCAKAEHWRACWLSRPPGKEEEPMRGTEEEGKGALDASKQPVPGRKSDPLGPMLCTHSGRKRWGEAQSKSGKMFTLGIWVKGRGEFFVLRLYLYF